MKKILKRLLAFSLATALSVVISVPVAFASATRTATEITITCSGTTMSFCTGSFTRPDTNSGNCENCGNLYFTYTKMRCPICNGYDDYDVRFSPCGCGRYTNSSNVSKTGPGHYVTNTPPCSHGYSSSHQVSTGNYQNAAYGYSGTSATFRVYAVDVTTCMGVSVSSIKATGATATDYFLNGKSITVTLSNTTGSDILVHYDGNQTLLSGTAPTYKFTMPAKDISLVITPDKENQTINCQDTITTTFNNISFNIGATVSS